MANETADPDEPRLLSGGNPQIPKGDGDEPVQAYIKAMPAWKSDVGRWIDSLVDDEVDDVRKGVRWNSPFYGSSDGGWFLSMHCFTKYVKVTFFDGASLEPAPADGGKDPKARWVNIHETDDLDDERWRDWIRQAASLPGWSGS